MYSYVHAAEGHIFTVTHHCHTLKNEWVPCGVLLGSVWPEIGGLMRAGAKGRHPRS